MGTFQKPGNTGGDPTRPHLRSPISKLYLAHHLTLGSTMPVQLSSQSESEGQNLGEQRKTLLNVLFKQGLF